MATAPRIPDEEPRFPSSSVPVELYLHSAEWDPDAEFVDGEILERPMGENDHSAWQLAIQTWFQQHAKEWNIRVRPELRVQLVPRENYRVPDVAILDRALAVEPIATHPPVAVFEVLSPEDRWPRMMRKLEDYQSMGITQIWIIDPKDSSFRRYLDGQLVQASQFDEPAKGIHFDLKEIEALLD